MSRNWVARVCALGVLCGAAAVSFASIQDASVVIDHALNSPTLTVRYNGANVAMVELVVNGTSVGTRVTDPALTKGETRFTLDLSALNPGDNDVEVRLYDKDGKVLGSETSSVSTEQQGKAPVFLQGAKLGATVQGPVQISVGFGKELHNSYVSFFVDNQFKSMTNTPPFAYIWDTTRDSNGWHELEAWVVDDSSTTYKTKRIKVYVNNPGGNTFRQFNQPLVPAPVTPVPTVATPSVVPALQTSSVTPVVSVAAVGQGAKPATLGNAQIAAHAVADVVPSITPNTVKVAPSKTSSVAASKSSSVIITNTVKAEIGHASGTKAIESTEVVASGPRLLLPTGKRVAETGKPALSGPIGKTAVRPAAIHATKVPALPKVEAVEPVVASKAPIAPKENITGAGHAIAAAKVAEKIAVTHGTKLPNVGAYSISLNSKTVQFDSVKPRVQDNIPLTPFRYLFEQSGGKVDWHSKAKSVTASGEGHEIYIKIGDKLAKVNSLPVQLDLTPFIDHGRTIVPLSFIQDALDVEVDYDPVTNHVLITSIKKKK